MINHEHKFIFLHIPKTAGMSMGKAFYNHSGIEKVYEGFGVHHDDLTLDILKEYFVFTFVRNPWDRLYSQYKFRNWLHKHTFEDVAYDIEGKFSEYYNKTIDENRPLSTLKEERVNYFDEFVHLPSQVSFLCGKYNDGIDKLPYIDFVGRFENINEDWKTVCNAIGLGNISLPHLNKGNNVFNKTYKEVYTEETKEFVRKKYYDDIITFDYEF